MQFAITSYFCAISKSIHYNWCRLMFLCLIVRKVKYFSNKMPKKGNLTPLL
jgi:hypothetical protein